MSNNNSLDNIKRLREKLGSACNYIQTIRGVGYRFNVSNQ